MKKILVMGLVSIMVFVCSGFKSDAWSEDYVKDGYVVEVYGLITQKRRGMFGQKIQYMVTDQYGHQFGDGSNPRFEAFMQKNVGEYVKVTIENFGKLSHSDTSIFKYGNFDVLEWELSTEEEFLETKLNTDEAKNVDSYNVPYDEWIANKEQTKNEKEEKDKEAEYEKRIKELEDRIKELEELLESLEN